MSSKSAIITLTFVALLACGAPTGGCSCSPRPPHTDFVGFVTGSNGPVNGARVTESVFTRDCQSPAPADVYVQSSGAVADATGHYGLALSTDRPDTLCARLVAQTSTDSVVRDSILVQVFMQDSLRVDFHFP